MSFNIGDRVKSMESHFNVRLIPLFGEIVARRSYDDDVTLTRLFEYQVKWENGTTTYNADHELMLVSDEEYQTAKKQEEEFIKSLKLGKNIAVAEPVEPVDIQPINQPLYDALETLKDYYREKIQQIEQMQKDITGGK